MPRPVRVVLTVLIAWGCQQLWLPNVAAGDAAELGVVLYALAPEGRRQVLLALLLAAFLGDVLTAGRVPSATVAALGVSAWYLVSSLATTSWQTPLRRWLTLVGLNLLWYALRLGALALDWLVHGSPPPRFFSPAYLLGLALTIIVSGLVGEGWYKLRQHHQPPAPHYAPSS